MPSYSIGLDYGTSSVRGLLVDIQNGAEIASSVFPYPQGKAGILLDDRDPDLARQHPQDYLDGAAAVITGVLSQGKSHAGFDPSQVIGIGVDTTGSTPIPVNAEGVPLALTPEFSSNLAAFAWLWKDHTGFAEAVEITALASQIRPEYLAKCGGIYSSEWYWSKVLHCLRTAPEVFQAATTWVEHADWLPAVLSGTTHPDQLKRGICAAGHKALFHSDWGGYPDEEFLSKLDPRLVTLRQNLPRTDCDGGCSAGLHQTPRWQPVNYFEIGPAFESYGNHTNAQMHSPASLAPDGSSSLQSTRFRAKRSEIPGRG